MFLHMQTPVKTYLHKCIISNNILMAYFNAFLLSFPILSWDILFPRYQLPFSVTMRQLVVPRFLCKWNHTVFTGLFPASIIHVIIFIFFYVVQYIYSLLLFITEQSSILWIYLNVFIHHLLMDISMVSVWNYNK